MLLFTSVSVTDEIHPLVSRLIGFHWHTFEHSACGAFEIKSNIAVCHKQLAGTESEKFDEKIFYCFMRKHVSKNRPHTHKNIWLVWTGAGHAVGPHKSSL